MTGSLMGGVLMTGSSATIRAPCCERIDSGWNCTPTSGRSRWATAIVTPLCSSTAVRRSTGGQDHGGERVVAHGLERIRHAAEQAVLVVVDDRDLTVGRVDTVDGPVVRRDEGLHAEADTEHGHAEVEHRRAQGEVGGDRGMTGTRREDDVGGARRPVEHSGGVVLDDLGQPAGHRGDQVHEVPRVGVVVVDHEHPRCPWSEAHPNSSSEQPTQEGEAVLGQDRLGVELHPAVGRTGQEVDVTGRRVGLDADPVGKVRLTEAADEGVVEPDPLLPAVDVDRGLRPLEDDVLVVEGDPEPVAQDLVAQAHRQERLARVEQAVDRPAVGRDLRVVVVAGIARPRADDDEVHVVERSLGALLE